MRNITFAIDASTNLSTSRRALAHRLIAGVLNLIDPHDRFSLVLSNQELTGYKSGEFRPAAETNAAIDWFNNTPSGGRADLRPLLDRLASLSEPTFMVLMNCGSLGDSPNLRQIANSAPVNLFVFGVALDCEAETLWQLDGQFLGGSEFHQCHSQNWAQILAAIQSRLASTTSRKHPLWEFKRQLDLCFGPDTPQPRQASLALFRAFDRALDCTQNSEYESLVRLELQQGRAGFAYSWFGGALTLLEKAQSSPLPEPHRVSDFIAQLESDLERKRGAQAPWGEHLNAILVFAAGSGAPILVLSEDIELLDRSAAILGQAPLRSAKWPVPCLDQSLRDPERKQLDADGVVEKLRSVDGRYPLLLLVHEDLFRSSKPEWRFSFGQDGPSVAVLSTCRLEEDRFDKMLFRYIAKACGSFRSSSDPASVFFDPIMSILDIDRMDRPRPQ